MATHYTTLGVAPDVPQPELRRAYIAEARRWHPDRFVGTKPAEAEKAESAMRRVNEAWHVLGDETRRRAYDRELAASVSGATSLGGAIRRDDGIPRIDPRLLDPDFLASRRRYQEDESEVRHSGIIRTITAVGFFGLLIGIFIFTAYANGPVATNPTSTIPGPAIGVDAGTCVRQMSGGQLLSVPCSGSSDGVVIGARELDGICPAPTVRELILPSDIIVCLAQGRG